jgi:hypothetical protein
MMSHHKNTGSPAIGQGNDVPMSQPQDTEPPTAEQDDDVQMSNTMDIYRPKTWEQLEGHDTCSAMQAAMVSRDQLPQWFVRIVECINVTERDIQGLFHALQQEGVMVQADISQMKALYQEMAETMQTANDIVIKRGDIEKEINHAAILHLVQASNEFRTQVWQTMGGLATDIQRKQEANEEAAQRLTTGVQIINDVLEGFTTQQENWNKNVENWASEKEDRDRKCNKRIRVLTRAEEWQQQRQLQYEAVREQEKKELIDKVIQTVVDRMANRQLIDAQSLAEAIQEPNQWQPSLHTFNTAIGTALPPSHSGTDLGSNAGNGGRGNDPPRRRVGLPPSDPSDSSSSDEGAGPRRRIPMNPPRRRRNLRPEKEEDKAERFF